MLIFTDFQWCWDPKMSRKSLLFPSLFEKANLAKTIIFLSKINVFQILGYQKKITPKSIQKHVRKTDRWKIELKADFKSIFKGF